MDGKFGIPNHGLPIGIGFVPNPKLHPPGLPSNIHRPPGPLPVDLTNESATNVMIIASIGIGLYLLYRKKRS